MENEKLFEFMEKIYSEMQQGFKNVNDRMENRMYGLEGKIEGIEFEVRKNSIKLETIEKKIDIIAEVQTAKSISKDTRDIKESIDVMKDVIGRHQIDIEILKRRPV